MYDQPRLVTAEEVATLLMAAKQYADLAESSTTQAGVQENLRHAHAALVKLEELRTEGTVDIFLHMRANATMMEIERRLNRTTRNSATPSQAT